MKPHIIQRLEIDAGHRLLKHEGKCRNVHGHRYVFEVELAAPQLDDIGRVIDFGAVKHLLGGWLDTHLDHGFIAQVGDPLIDVLRYSGDKLYVMDVPPTAENLALHVFNKFAGMVEHPLQAIALTVWETPNCRAVVRR